MIEIRESRISDSADQTPAKDGTIRVGKLTTYYGVYLDGRRVDRFLSRAAAERKVAELRNCERGMVG